MAKLSITIPRVNPQVGALEQTAGKLSAAASAVDEIRSGLRFKIACRDALSSRLRVIAEEIEREEQAAAALGSGLQAAASRYAGCEQQILSRLKPAKKADFNRNGAGADGGSPDNADGGSDEDKVYLIDGSGNIIGFTTDDTEEDAVWKEETSETKDGVTKKTKEEIGKTTTETSADGHIFRLDKDGNVVLDPTIHAKAEASVSAYEAEGSVAAGTGIASAAASGSVDLLNADASAEANAQFRDEDGNIRPEVDAEAGASVSAFSAEGQASVGNDMIGAGVSGKATVGEASAKANVKGQLYDEDGNLDPSISAGVAAEAVAAKAEASADVNLAGITGTATASGEIGIGAHAKVEVGDGKISADIGAAIGIGGSLAFSVDYGKAIDAAQDTCKSAFNTVKGWFTHD